MNNVLIVMILIAAFATIAPIYMDYVAHGSWFWNRLDPSTGDPIDPGLSPNNP